MRIKFRLLYNSYSIAVRPTYCGAIATSLTPRSGEDWLRGNDLRDGKLWRLPEVLWEVLNYEFRFGRWRHARKVSTTKAI